MCSIEAYEEFNPKCSDFTSSGSGKFLPDWSKMDALVPLVNTLNFIGNVGYNYLREIIISEQLYTEIKWANRSRRFLLLLQNPISTTTTIKYKLWWWINEKKWYISKITTKLPSLNNPILSKKEQKRIWYQC